MHTAVRRYVNVADPDEVVRRIKEEGFVDLIRGVRGFVDYIVIDDGGGVLVTISTSFEDRYGAEESTTVAMEWIQEHGLGSLLPSPPQITEGEAVVLEER
jgi:hypothetical protein